MVLPKLLQTVECVYYEDSEASHLPPQLRVLDHTPYDDAELGQDSVVPEYAMVCWEGTHLWLASVSLIALIFYCITTTMLSPFFSEDYSGLTEMTFTRYYGNQDRLLKVQIYTSKGFLVFTTVVYYTTYI